MPRLKTILAGAVAIAALLPAPALAAVKTCGQSGACNQLHRIPGG